MPFWSNLFSLEISIFGSGYLHHTVPKQWICGIGVNPYIKRNLHVSVGAEGKATHAFVCENNPLDVRIHTHTTIEWFWFVPCDPEKILHTPWDKLTTKNKPNPMQTRMRHHERSRIWVLRIFSNKRVSHTQTKSVLLKKPKFFGPRNIVHCLYYKMIVSNHLWPELLFDWL